MAQIIWSESASDEVDEIETDFLKVGADPGKTLRAIFSSIDQLIDFPYQGPAFLQLKVKDLRQLVVLSDYRILYRTDGESVMILAVFHTSRHLRNAWRSRSRDLIFVQPPKP